MEWIDVKALEAWADRVDARAHLMKMLVDLINATVSESHRLRFPHGEKGQVRGWDGDLEVPVGQGRVPEGCSKWEFGTGAAETKANADYQKRTAQSSAEVMSKNTLVIVNLTTWDTPRKKIADWQDDRNREGKWKEVRCIDGTELAHWLGEHPAIAARYARDYLGRAPKEGALSTDEYWEEFSTQFEPELSEKLVIAGRKTEADEIIAHLSGPAKSTLLGAETSEEVIAFSVAAIRSAPDDVRRDLESRTLILRSESAARFFSKHSNMCFLVTGDAEPMAGKLGNNCPTLSAVTGVANRRHNALPRPTASAMAEGFASMGMEHGEGYELAHRCGRSLTILKRLKHKVRPKDPEWLPMVAALVPAFLAGGWSSDLEKDREVVAELAEVPRYGDIERELVKTLVMSDRPIDREEEVWQVRAAVDAFFFYQEVLTERDFDRLGEAVIKVFSHEPEKPARDQKFSLSNSGPAGYSSWLRDGLATTLLIMAAMSGKNSRKIRGQTIQQYIERLFLALPDWGKSYAPIARLGEQVALLAEAAPAPFLAALESINEGDANRIFGEANDADDAFDTGAYAHHELLWALETIAWNPRYLTRACLLLARLAALDPDPGSNHVTRPINSLREIFVPWSPGTYASQAKRIVTIDAIIAAHPDIAWDLVCKLLPRHHDSSSPTRKPKLSDQSPKEPEEVTFGLVWDFQSAIVGRAIELAKDREERLAILVGSLGQMQPTDRDSVLEAVDGFLAGNQVELGLELWHKLNGELARNKYFSSAAWAMKDEQLTQLQGLVDRHMPPNPLAVDRLVFDDWTPMVGNYERDAGANPEEIRRQVLQKVMDRDGIEGIVALAKIVKLPGLVASTVAGLTLSMDELFELLIIANYDEAVPDELAYYASACGARAYGQKWLEGFAVRLAELSRSDEQTVKMLAALPANRSTWSLVDSLGSHIKAMYWQKTSSLPSDGPMDDLMHAITQLQTARRSVDVLAMLNKRAVDVPTDTLEQLLIESCDQLNAGFERYGNMLRFYLARTLEELRGRADVAPFAVAMLEYSLFQFVHRESNELTLFKLMAREPALFVDLLSKMYRRKDAAQDEEIGEDVKREARAAFRVVHEFKEVPGLEGEVVDEGLLRSWVSEVKARSRGAAIEEPTDRRVGALLAHSPVERQGETWPCNAVCRVIEELASEHMESGFQMECFNKRGVHSRGINEGGGQERELAARYQAWSDALPHFPRVSAMLLSVADGWRAHAEREDVEAEQSKMKM
ncbi:hypothetical protein R1V99_01145 [Stenotrophomonas maltophilia]|nr:hypothetical protein [Stenotrophomonas maltophilia]